MYYNIVQYHLDTEWKVQLRELPNSSKYVIKLQRKSKCTLKRPFGVLCQYFFFKEHNLSSRNIINVLNHQNVNLSETYKQKAILTEELEKSNQVKFNKNAQIKSKERNLY